MIKGYEKYKDSGVEWIGEIPEGWEVKRLKFVGEAIIGITYSPSEVTTENNGILVLRSSNVQNGELAFEDCVYVDKKLQDRDYTKEGDILICARNGSAHLVGKCAYVDRANIGHSFGAFMTIVRSQFGRYLYHFFSSEIFKSQTGLFSTSTINQLTSDTLNNLRIAFPNLSDQASITAFLDRKTTEIGQLIANKEKLFSLYEEEKTAIINHAVTKGLDPNVKTKPSGIEWLGDIPEHWEVKRLKYLVSSLESGASVNATDFPAIGNEYGILKTSCVYNYNFNAQENKAIWENELDRAKVSPRKGSIIISRMNTPDLVGASGYVEYDYPTLFLPDRLWQTVFFQDVEISAKWLSYILKCNGFRKLLSITATGTSPSMKNLGQEEFLNISIPFMEIGEQTAIVTHIETECSRLDTIIEKFKKQIELFKEYRTTLISEVVTGKIDVRDEVAA